MHGVIGARGGTKQQCCFLPGILLIAPAMSSPWTPPRPPRPIAQELRSLTPFAPSAGYDPADDESRTYNGRCFVRKTPRLMAMPPMAVGMLPSTLVSPQTCGGTLSALAKPGDSRQSQELCDRHVSHCPTSNAALQGQAVKRNPPKRGNNGASRLAVQPKHSKMCLGQRKLPTPGPPAVARTSLYTSHTHENAQWKALSPRIKATAQALKTSLGLQPGCHNRAFLSARRGLFPR